MHGLKILKLLEFEFSHYFEVKVALMVRSKDPTKPTGKFKFKLFLHITH